MDFISNEFEMEGRRVKTQFWDTAGQERYASIAQSYYKVADGVLLVYDVTSRESFEKLDKRLNSITDLCAAGV